MLPFRGVCFSFVCPRSSYLKRSDAGEDCPLGSMTVVNCLPKAVLVDLPAIRLQVLLDLCLEGLLENLLSSAAGSLNQQRFYLLDPRGNRAVRGILLVGHTSFLQMVLSLSEGYAPFLSFPQSTNFYSTLSRCTIRN